MTGCTISFSQTCEMNPNYENPIQYIKKSRVTRDISILFDFVSIIFLTFHESQFCNIERHLYWHRLCTTWRLFCTLFIIWKYNPEGFVRSIHFGNHHIGEQLSCWSTAFTTGFVQKLKWSWKGNSVNLVIFQIMPRLWFGRRNSKKPFLCTAFAPS